MKRAIIFANGTLPDPFTARKLIQSDDLIIAADGGLRNALAAGVKPQVVIGDFDSTTTAELMEAEKSGALVLRFPREKDETDLELAIRHALDQHAQEIVVIAAVGGRLDQTLGNMALLADVPNGVQIRLDDGSEEVMLVDSRVSITGRPGDVVSLIPWGETVTGIRTEGLRFPLQDEPLLHHKTRGISNEMLGNKAVIHISGGKLLIVHTRMVQNE